jgi:hypothetical protein
MSFNTIPDRPIGCRPTEKAYPSPEAILAYLQELGDENGYAVKKADQNPSPARLLEAGRQYPNYILYTCTKARKAEVYESHVDKSKQRKKTGSKRTQCPFRVKAVRLDDEGNEWRLDVLKEEHNHEPHMAGTADAVNRLARQPQSIFDEIDRLNLAGVSTAKILASLKLANPDINLTPRDIYNRNVRSRQQSLNGKPPVQWLMDV